MYDSRLTPCRLIVDATASGAWQMALDEVLLESAARHRTASLRFYQWSEPTLSLGYFQCVRQRQDHPASRDCPLVRRQTGGGAILHDRELTYSLALPQAHPLALDASRLYLAVHEALVRSLAAFYIPTTLRAASGSSSSASEPFLCFQRRTRGDVLLGPTKVCGSAQRRRRGAILQHGSLLLASSPQAPELPGLLELSGKTPDLGLLIESWGREIGAGLALALTAQKTDAAELADARLLLLEKYTAGCWNERR